jgi:hypothetical protein
LSNGAWEWTNGEAVNYLNWSPNEPNNYGGTENYGMIIVLMLIQKKIVRIGKSNTVILRNSKNYVMKPRKLLVIWLKNLNYAKMPNS